MKQRKKNKIKFLNLKFKNLKKSFQKNQKNLRILLKTFSAKFFKGNFIEISFEINM